MAFEDTQMDVLLRRYSDHAKSNLPVQHLDADELNAFAEGALPAAARSRCVSHLSDCDDCRKLVSQLAITAGAIAKTESAKVSSASGESWVTKLGAFFRPRALRYAALAALVIAAGVALFVIEQNRRSRQAALVAQNDQPGEVRVNAIKPEATPAPDSHEVAKVSSATPSVQSGPQPASVRESEKSRTGENAPAPPKIQQDAQPTPAEVDKAVTEPQVVESKPAYAPPPPEERRAGMATNSSDRQLRPGIGGTPAPNGGTLFGKTATLDRKETDELSNKQSKDYNQKAAQNENGVNGRLANEKARAPRRDADNVAAGNRNVTEPPAAAPKNEDARAGKSNISTEASETRSAGGHKFHRQGSAWIDNKFKSSMSMKSIARGSSEFEGLDSQLRSIAGQFSGEVIVVWKGKAYAFH
jgi:hypothetical protein